MAELTQKEIIAELKKVFPTASDAALKQDAALIKDQKTLDYVKVHKDLPESWMQSWGIDPKVHLEASGKNTFGQAVQDSLLAAIFLAGPGKAGKGFKAVGALTKGLFAKKAAEEAAVAGAKGAVKMSLKKKAAIGAVTLYAGSQAAGALSNKGGKDTTAADAANAQAQADMATAIANANAAGVDVTTLLNSPTAQALNLNAGNIQSFMAGFGVTGALPGIGGVGVYTGKETMKHKLGPKGHDIPYIEKEMVSLADWKKSFPADLNGINSLKQKFVDAGVISPSAQIDDVKKAYEAYGQMSLDYSRAGNKVSPWDLLKIQKGLSGGGSQTTVTYDTSPMAEADITTLFKRQLQQSLGIANVDDATIKNFIASVRKKESKRPTKTVSTTTGKTTTRNTTPGYGTSDVLSDAEAWAKKDPRYSEFQTASVFGDALVKALGLKS